MIANTLPKSSISAIFVFLAVLVLGGCSTPYQEARERIGVTEQTLLRWKRIRAMRDAFYLMKEHYNHHPYQGIAKEAEQIATILDNIEKESRQCMDKEIHIMAVKITTVSNRNAMIQELYPELDLLKQNLKKSQVTLMRELLEHTNKLKESIIEAFQEHQHISSAARNAWNEERTSNTAYTRPLKTLLTIAIHVAKVLEAIAAAAYDRHSHSIQMTASKTADTFNKIIPDLGLEAAIFDRDIEYQRILGEVS